MPKYNIKQVPRELLEEFILHNTGVLTGQDFCCTNLGGKIREAATVKLRTKAEVDAEIASAVRQYTKWWTEVEHHRLQNLSFSCSYGPATRPLPVVLIELLSEETDG